MAKIEDLKEEAKKLLREGKVSTSSVTAPGPTAGGRTPIYQEAEDVTDLSGIRPASTTWSASWSTRKAGSQAKTA